jgi:uncharacterized protein (TIGR03437 family)
VKGRICMNRLRSYLFVAGCIFAIPCSHAWAASLSFGQTQTGTISSAAQSNSYTFSANANDVVDFTMVATSGNLSPKIQLFKSDGTVLGSAANYACSGSTIEMNTVKLPATGTYTAVVADCGSTNTGNYGIYAQLTNNPVGAAAAPLGQTQTATIGSAAQSNSYTFSASANDVVDLTMTTTSGNLSPKLRLYSPAGTQVGSANNYACSGSTIELNTVKLPASGTYTVLAGDCADSNTGSYWIYVQRTNNPSGATNLLFGGQVQTGIIASAAQSDSYTFSGSANDGLNFTMVSAKGALSPKIRVYKPDGTLLGSANNYACSGSTIQLNQVKLPATGNYTLLVGDCGDTNTGNYNLSSQCFGVCPSPVSTPLPQTITFGAPNNQVMGIVPFALSATASSGLPVTFTSNTTSVCTVSGVTVTMVAVGTCSITASQPGNSTYVAATPVTQTFTISPSTSPVGTTVYDLSSNWSNSSNPNGPWSINQGATPLPFVPLWNAGSNSTIASSCNQPAWAPSNVPGRFLPAFFKLNACAAADPGLSTVDPNNPPQPNIVAGDVVVHTVDGFNGNPSLGAANILFTLPPSGGAGAYTISGSLWDALSSSTSSSRPQDWSLFLGGTQISSGRLSGAVSRSRAQTFSQVETLNPGDQVKLQIVEDPASGAGFFVGVDLTITPVNSTPPPANCSYALAPATQVFPAATGTGTVGVLTAAGCPWTASTTSSFLSIASGASGTGPGVVQFSATANTGPSARAGTLTILGQTATVNQAGTAPLLLLSPTSIAVQWRQQGPLPTAIPLSVFTAASSLSFTAAASSTGSWLAVSPASGGAPATIVVTVNPSSLQPGTYQGTVTVTAPTANPSSQSFSVSLTVVASGSPAVSLTTTSLSYSFAQGSQQARHQRIPIGNSGGGTLSYIASASTNSGGNWMSLTQDGAGATLSTPDLLTVNIDPSSLGVGTYTGLIAITADTTQTIPVTVTVSAVQQTILLSQTGLTFTAVANGGIVPPQTFGILNSGSGSMDWSVSSSTVTGGNNWLSVTPNSGTTDAGSLTVPLVTVSVNPASLAPGQYSGQIQITSQAANNTPEFVSVILNVLPAGSNPGPLVLPSGLIFTEAVGGTAAGSQKITLSNLTGSPLTFASGKLTNDGVNWFSVTPATGTATSTQATTLTVAVSSAGLSPAIRQGVLTLLFQDGSVRTVNILYLLAAGGVSSSSADISHPWATSGTCTPTKLLPLVTSLGSQFTVPAGWPNTLAAQVVDDCGNPHVGGTVIATFSNGDPPLPLISLKNGNWTGTWQVRNASAPVIAVTVNADNPSLNIAGAISLSGGLQNSANAPVVRAPGVVNAASYSPSAPLSPGTIIAIFGSNLANGTASASTLPLPSELSGTLVTIGGKAAPLLYAGPGQINAVIPYGLPVNTNTQVIVQQGNAYTSPEPITLSASDPGILTKTAIGAGQGVIIKADGHFAEPGTPAQAGDEITIYAVGLGETTPQATAGQAASGSPLQRVAGVSLTIGGQPARVDFAGLAPGFAELYQINAAVPAGVSGDSVPVVLTVAGQPSPPVTMAVQ